MNCKKTVASIITLIPMVWMLSHHQTDNFKPSNRIELISVVDILDKEVEKAKREKNREKLELMRAAEKAKDNIEDNTYIQREDRPEFPSRGVIKTIPYRNTNMKSYMDYKTVTDTASAQYKLLQKEDVYIDEEGFLRVGDKFLIAIGNYFGANVGQEVEVELSSGVKFNALIGDIKDDRHTDAMNLSHPDGSVVEFLVNAKNKEGESYPEIGDLPRKMGDMSYAEKVNLKGDVVSITILENE